MKPQDIGVAVKAIRTELGMTVTDLAKKIGISQAQIARLENGQQDFRSQTLVRIARALKVPPFRLFMTEDSWVKWKTVGEPAPCICCAEFAEELAFSRVSPDPFWQAKSLDELAEEQGVRPVERMEDVFGRGASLWDSDEEFEEFLAGIEERRHDGSSA